MSSVETIFVTRHRQTRVTDAGGFRYTFDVVNFPGIEIVAIVNETMEPHDQSIRFNGRIYATVDAAASAWREERERQFIRDRVGEALRRFSRGLIYPLWADMGPEQKQGALEAADVFTRLLTSFGLRVSRAEDR